MARFYTPCAKHENSHIQNLAHILNGCAQKFPKYIERINLVKIVIVGYSKSLLNVEIFYTIHTVHINNIPEFIGNLRADITWHSSRSACMIIEVSIPYGSFRWGNDTLELVYQMI